MSSRAASRLANLLLRLIILLRRPTQVCILSASGPSRPFVSLAVRSEAGGRSDLSGTGLNHCFDPGCVKTRPRCERRDKAVAEAALEIAERDHERRRQPPSRGGNSREGIARCGRPLASKAAREAAICGSAPTRFAFAVTKAIKRALTTGAVGEIQTYSHREPTASFAVAAAPSTPRGARQAPATARRPDRRAVPEMTATRKQTPPARALPSARAPSHLRTSRSAQ